MSPSNSGKNWIQPNAISYSSIRGYSWVFKEFLFTRRFTSALLVNNPNTGGLERHLLLHIVYPDSFEAMLGTDKKNLAKAKAFSRLVTDKSADPDRTIKQIRKGLEARFTKDIHFYGDEIRQYWKPKKGQSVKEELECEDTPPPNGSDLNTLAGELFLTEPADFLHEIETLLVEKKQVIFQGPPGNGEDFRRAEARQASCRLGGAGDTRSIPPVLRLRGLRSGLPPHAAEREAWV